MSDINSNLILKVRVPAPEKSGFKAIHSELDLVHAKLRELTSQNWTIKVGVTVSGISDLDKLIKAVRKQGGEVGPSNYGAGITQTSGGIPVGQAPGGIGKLKQRRVKRNETEGVETSRTLTYQASTPTVDVITNLTTTQDGTQTSDVIEKLKEDHSAKIKSEVDKFTADQAKKRFSTTRFNITGDVTTRGGTRDELNSITRDGRKIIEKKINKDITRYIAVASEHISKTGVSKILSGEYIDVNSATGEVTPGRINDTTARRQRDREINRFRRQQYEEAVRLQKQADDHDAAVQASKDKRQGIFKIRTNINREANNNPTEHLFSDGQYTSLMGQEVRSKTRNIVDLATGKTGELQTIERISKTYTAINGEVVPLAGTITKINTLTGVATEEVGKYLANNRRARREIEAQRDAIRERNALAARQNQVLSNPGAEGTIKYDRNGNVIGFAGQTSSTDPNSGLRTTTTSTEKGDTVKVDQDPEIRRMRKYDNRRARNAAAADQEVQRALAEGFAPRQSTTSSTFDQFGRAQTNTVQEFARATTLASGEFAVAVRTVSDSTGKMTEKLLSGGAAIRYMGDSFRSAVGKVILWTAATSAVFTTVAALKAAAQASAELEKGTVFLSRVGQGLGDTDKQRIQTARELTREILTLSSATGVDAIKSQQAAAVFLRTGQDKATALNSVKVALLASRIAELDVVDSANLLSSAQLQFKLRSDQLLPTLDAVNELSNRYRVSTNDLLQSISRTGSVAAQQGTSLTELAGITAIVSQRTARSGAEIGNALKTISSRLVAPEVVKRLAEVGIALRDAAGNSKPLNTILLELKNRFLTLSKAQQDELTVLIAGVRQRNILVSAIEGSTDAVIAEAVALQQTGSSTEKAGSALNEFLQTTGTLDAATTRLQQHLIELASNAGGPLNSTLKTLANTGSLLTRSLSGTGGEILTGITLSAAAYLGLSFAANKASTSVTGLTVSTAAQNLAARYSSATSFLQAAGYTGIELKARAASAAIYGLTGSTVASLAVAGAYTAGIAVVGYGIAALINKNEELTAATKLMDKELEQSAARAIERQRSLAQASKITLEAALRNSKLAGGDKKGNAQGLLEEAQRLVKASGIVIPARIKIGTDEFNNELLALIQEADAKIASSAKRQAELDIKSQRNKISETETDARNKKLNARLPGQESRFDALTGKVSIYDSYAKEFENIAALTLSVFTLENKVLALQKLRNAEAEKAAALLKEQRLELDKMIAAQNRQKGIFQTEEEKAKYESDKAFVAGFAGEDNRARRSLDSDIKNSVNDKFDKSGVFSFRQARAELVGANELYQRTKDQKELLEKTGETLEDVAKAYHKAFDSAAKDATKLGVTLQENLVKLNRDATDTRFEVGDQQQNRRFRLRAIRREEDPAVTALAIATAKRDTTKQRLDEQLKEQNRPGATPESILAAQQTAAQLALDLKKQEIDLLKKAEDLEVSILEKRKAYAKAQAEATKEILRGVNGLSDEDKLRLIVQKQYFEANPNVRLNQNDLFNMQGANANIAQNFFAGNILKPEDDPAAQAFVRGLKTPEQVKQEEEKKKIDEMEARLREAQPRGAANAARDQEAAAVEAGNKAFAIENANLAATFNIQIGLGNNFDRLLSAFNLAVGASMQALEQRLAQQVADATRTRGVSVPRAVANPPSEQ